MSSSSAVCGKIAAEATRWWLCCEDDPQEQGGAELILQMHDVVDCAGSLGPLSEMLYRAEVGSSFITTTVLDGSQVTPQGRHQ